MTPTAEDTTAARLALAKDAFDYGENHVAAIEAKARTFLTVNSLLVGAGVVSTLRSIPESSGLFGLWAVLILLTIGLLGFVALAFWRLFRVLGVRRFEGLPNPTKTLEELTNADGATMRESLAHYYSNAADKDRLAAASMVEDLKRAIEHTKRAFIVFVFSAVMIVITISVSEEGEMNTILDSVSRIIGSDEPRTVPESDSTSIPGGPSPTPAPGQTPAPTPPAPMPITGNPIERGDAPLKKE